LIGKYLKIDIKKYKTIVFDCDGVVLNSNHLKIQAYFDVAIQFGASQAQAQALVDHHIALGGISRYPKFEYFLREIMHQAVTEDAMHQLLQSFTSQVKSLLSACEISPGLDALKKVTKTAKWMILSGGDQAEIREIFKLRGLDSFFEAGIFGSPDNKDQVLNREKNNGNIQFPALFIGDSRYDYQASTQAGLDFVFLSDWTDVPDWTLFCAKNNINTFNNLAVLIPE
jgi:phosphoglycolate phosphatase-like HAD superfamily hydrolase